MDLILEVISPQPSVLGGAARQTFGAGGGTIGRDSGNSWVLPHAKVSGRHAVITFAGGVFYIEDTSRNGVFLNSSPTRLARGEPHPLSSGDRLLIEPYEIRVSVGSGAAPSRERADPLGDVDPFDLLGDPTGDDPFAPQPIRGSGFDAPPPPRRSAGFDAPQPMRPPGFETSEPVSSDELDPLALLNLQEERAAPRKAPSARDLEGGSPLDAHFRPPAVMGEARSAPEPAGDPLAIPQDYDPLAPDEPAPRPPRPAPPPPRAAPAPPVVDRTPPPPDADPRPVRPRFGKPPRLDVPPPAPPPRFDVPAAPPRVDVPPAPPRLEAPAPPPRVEVPPAPVPAPPRAARTGSAGGTDLGAVLEGAGLDPADVTPELARAFGQIIRVVVSGVMDVLQSRRQIKDEFRMRMTQFRPAENNPLKFSANVEDALHNLLVKRNAAYLGPVEAFEDAFSELRNHQLAMLAGMRVAFESMLAEFDPDRMQEDFDRQGGKGFGPAKLRYWDLFREKRREMVKDPEAAFRELFGEEFARAYEEQLKQLKSQDSAASPTAVRPKPPSES